MKKKTRVRRTWATLIALGALVFFLAHQAGGRGAGNDIGDWEQHPPIASRVTVQKLDRPLETGENMLLEVAYLRGSISVSEFILYPNENYKVRLHDDGLNGDIKAGDFVFSSYITEDIETFQKKMGDFDYSLSGSSNQLIKFTGRVGTILKRDQAFFNRDAFLSGRKIDLPRDIFNLPARTPATPIGLDPSDPPPPPAGAAPVIFKERSLFITDLGVVEDPARTFDPCDGAFGSGNPNGAWTFGTLMKGMANQTFTGVSASAFVQHWLRRWTVDTIVNSERVPNRSARMISLVIAPWINKARHATTPSVNASNWITIWNGINQDSLLRYAPFKLTAIVNRLDLRGNSGYGGFNNTGETRFIYSVIKNTATNCRDSIGSGGLDGFNVIFEYGNIQRRCSALQAYAMQWVNLSSLVPGSASYNSALEAITHNVTDSNAVPSKPNRSAINQVRTNEIALSNSNDTIVNPPGAPTWQFREFHLMSTNNHLEQSPPALEPQSKYNGHNGATAADVTLLANWVNSNTAAIKSNNFTVPLTLGGGQPFQAGKVNYQSQSPLDAPDFWDGSSSPGSGFITDDTARQVFSSNTCKGCHSAEPKTVFTHIQYVGRGVTMPYATTYRGLFSPTTGSHKAFVSPFLTGVDRVLLPGATAPFSSSSFHFGDDSTSVSEDATDATLTGLFYANDPAGRLYPGTTVVRKWGFNDLERRAQDLSNFVTNICSPSISIGVAQAVFFQPLNMVH